MGNPRYLPREGVEAKPRMSQSDSLVSLPTLGEKYTLNLVMLTDFPDMLQNSSRTSLITAHLLPSALPNNTKSSAKHFNRPETSPQPRVDS